MSWYIWLIVAIVCFIIETFTVEFTFLMLGGSALIATGVAFGTESIVWQVLAFSLAALVLILFARPWALKKMNPKGAAAGNVYGQVGSGSHAHGRRRAVRPRQDWWGCVVSSLSGRIDPGGQ